MTEEFKPFMARIIKAPNVKNERDYNIVEREKVIHMAEDDAADIIANAQQRYDAMIQEAEAQIQDMKAVAEQEIDEQRLQVQAENETLKAQVREQAHQEGLQNGQSEAKKQVQGIIQELKQMMAEGRQVLEGMFIDQEAEIRELVCHIVGKVIQEKLETDDEIVVRTTKECIQMAADRKNLRVLVHPDDKTKIEEWAPEFTRMFDDIDKITIETDTRVGKGGVIIESGTGGIDGRIEKQTDIVLDAVKNP